MRNWHLQGCVITGKKDKTNLWVNKGILSYLPETNTVYEKMQGYVLPGLVDMHCHLGMGEKGATSIATAQKQAEQNMKSGVLVIRDGGSMLNNEWFKTRMDMPTVFTAGNHISLEKRYIKNYSVELKDESELVKEVLYQAYRSKSWVKIVGDWIDRSNSGLADIEPLWSKTVLKEAIDAAHEMGVKVMAHTFGRKAAQDLIECGVDSIEHGTGLEKSDMQECVKANIPVIPTMLQRENFVDFARKAEGKFPKYQQTMLELYEKRYSQLCEMYDQGVVLLPGTDAGGHIQHGQIAEELLLWAKAGIDCESIVDFAFFKSREFLGVPVLEEYSNADIVVYDKDPRKDISVLASPKAVILKGKKI